MTGTPRFSVVTRLGEGSAESVSQTIDSVRAQTHADWELLLVPASAASADAARRLASRDSRTVVLDDPPVGGPAAWADAALDVARGEFVALLGDGDLLAEDALAQVSEVVDRRPDVDYVYTDHDVVGAAGPRRAVAKPAWSPERLRSHPYTGRLSVLRTSLVRTVGGFRPGFDGAEEHDLTLRVTERARYVEHVPRVLYHARAMAAEDVRTDTEAAAIEAGRLAVQEHVDRIGIDGKVEVDGPWRYRTRRVLPPDRRVSIVIPTRGSDAMVWGRRSTLVCRAVRSALAATRHENLEIVVVHDTPTPESVLAELRAIAGDRLRLVAFDEPFNYSRKMNLGVLCSTGDRLVLLNDDVQVRSDDWLEELLAPLEQPDVGLTGAKLYFSSTAIQHAGLAFSNGRYVHPYRRAPEDTTGPAMELMVDREVSGVTGACVGVRRDVYLEVGGLTELLRESFNDVDFCYKVTRAGYRTLYLAHCELFHFESQSREALPDPADDRFVRSRWGIPARDPFTPEFPGRPRWADRHANLAPRAGSAPQRG